jgi:hypothetical protein
MSEVSTPSSFLVEPGLTFQRRAFIKLPKEPEAVFAFSGRLLVADAQKHGLH